MLPGGVGTTVPAGVAAGPAGAALAVAGATVSFLPPPSSDDPQPASTIVATTIVAIPQTGAERRRAE
ncbi:Uncharacterised protein [Mycobacteroides abscessus subsp. abscessus]|nr:Uncharacterised protein [Mycobacteroides abscessus subsp. abscessus]